MNRLNSNPFSKMIQMIIGFVFMVSSGVLAQNAPITMAPAMQADSGSIISIPVLVSDFNNIGAISLTLSFDAVSLTYQSYTFNSAFSTFSIQNALPGMISIGGFSTSSSGITLTDSSVLFTLTFTFNGGSTGLIWYDNGSSCEYAGYIPDYTILNDSPQSTYYIDGTVSGFPLPGDAGAITGPSDGIVCDGETGIVFSIEPIPDATAYHWTLPQGASITAGNNTPQITVSFAPAANSGNAEVYGTNPYGSGTSSLPFPVTINFPPTIEIQPISPEPVYAGSGMATFTLSASGWAIQYQWQEFTSFWNNISDGGFYSGSQTDSLVISNPPYSFNNNRYRCLISGFCEPQAVSDGNATLTVSQHPLPGAAGSITGPAEGNICAGETGISFSIAPIANATGYNWTLPLGASITAGNNTNEISVSFSDYALNGNVLVQGTNPYGSGASSIPFPITVHFPPVIEIQPVSPEPVFADSGRALFSVSASGAQLTYQWQALHNEWLDILDGGFYSGTSTESLVIDNPPLSLNGTHYRCKINGFCEPQLVTDGSAFLTVYVFTIANQYPLDENNLLYCTVFPNPCRNLVTLHFILAAEAKIELEIADLSGKILKLPGIFQGKRGVNDIQIETNMLKPGFYTVRMHLKYKNHSTLQSLRLVIQP